jgi:hypothetical protein
MNLGVAGFGLALARLMMLFLHPQHRPSITRHEILYLQERQKARINLASRKGGACSGIKCTNR